MNKKILTAAIGAAMIAGPLAAQADLKIGGALELELYNVSGSAGGTFDGLGGLAQGDEGSRSRLVFDWSDDSGAFSRLAYNVGPAGGNVNTLKGRDQYVGYKADFGKITFGRIAGAIKQTNVDSMVTTFLQARKTSAAPGGNNQYMLNSFVSNLLQYSNKFAGGSYVVQYNPISIGGTGVTTNGDIGLNVKTKFGGVAVNAAYMSSKVGSAAGNANMMISAKGKVGDIKLAGWYASNEIATGTAVTSVFVNAEMGLGNGLSVGLGVGSDTTNSTTMTRLTVVKKLSKKAKFYGGYITDSGPEASGSGAGANVAKLGLGLRVDI